MNANWHSALVDLAAEQRDAGAVFLRFGDQLEGVVGRARAAAENADDQVRIVGDQLLHRLRAVIDDLQETPAGPACATPAGAGDRVVDELRQSARRRARAARWDRRLPGNGESPWPRPPCGSGDILRARRRSSSRRLLNVTLYRPKFAPRDPLRAARSRRGRTGCDRAPRCGTAATARSMYWPPRTTNMSLVSLARAAGVTWLFSNSRSPIVSRSFVLADISMMSTTPWRTICANLLAILGQAFASRPRRRASRAIGPARRCRTPCRHPWRRRG